MKNMEYRFPLCGRLCLVLNNIQSWHIAGSSSVSLLLGSSSLLGALFLLLEVLILNGLCAEDLEVHKHKTGVDYECTFTNKR